MSSGAMVVYVQSVPELPTGGYHVNHLPLSSYWAISPKRRNIMLWTIIVILVILWLLGFLGGNISPKLPRTGSWIHVLLVIVVILVVLNVLGIA
jgi:hypothetical protein